MDRARLESRHNLLSATSLSTFQRCKREHWLRYVARFPWPEEPTSSATDQSANLGKEFHDLMRRRFVGTEIDHVPEHLQPLLQAWIDHPVPLLPGPMFPEVALTARISQFWYTTRFDLLSLSQDKKQAMIVDFKTGVARSPKSYTQSIQTGLYLCSLVEGYSTLFPGVSISPENLTMVYWIARRPDSPVSIKHSTPDNLVAIDRITELSQKVSEQSPVDEPTRIDNMRICNVCRFRHYCYPQGDYPVVDDLSDQIDPSPDKTAPDLLPLRRN